MNKEELAQAQLWNSAYLTPEEAEGETAALAGGEDEPEEAQQ